MATRTEQLADALIKVATANHYMVGIVEPFTDEELDGAEQLIITQDNATEPDNAITSLALDIIEHERQDRLSRASRGVST